MENLEIRCSDGDSGSTKSWARKFLRSYALSIEGGPYAINAEKFPASGPGYGFTILVSPVERGKIVALVPSANNLRGSFDGANFQQDCHNDLSIVLDGIRYLLRLENPEKRVQQPTTPQPLCREDAMDDYIPRPKKVDEPITHMPGVRFGDGEPYSRPDGH